MCALLEPIPALANKWRARDIKIPIRIQKPYYLERCPEVYPSHVRTFSHKYLENEPKVFRLDLHADGLLKNNVDVKTYVSGGYLVVTAKLPATRGTHVQKKIRYELPEWVNVDILQVYLQETVLTIEEVHKEHVPESTELPPEAEALSDEGKKNEMHHSKLAPPTKSEARNDENCDSPKLSPLIEAAVSGTDKEGKDENISVPEIYDSCRVNDVSPELVSLTKREAAVVDMDNNVPDIKPFVDYACKQDEVLPESPSTVITVTIQDDKQIGGVLESLPTEAEAGGVDLNGKICSVTSSLETNANEDPSELLLSKTGACIVDKNNTTYKSDGDSDAGYVIISSEDEITDVKDNELFETSSYSLCKII